MKRFGSIEELENIALRTSGDNKELIIAPPSSLTGASLTLTLPDSGGVTDTLVSRVSSDIGANRLKNKELDDGTTLFVDTGDISKKARFLLNASHPTSTSNNYTLPVGGGDVLTNDSSNVLTNKTISGSTNTLVSINATSIIDGSVSNAEFGYLDGVTSAIQTQINSKQSDVVTTQGDVVVGDVSGDATRVAIGGSGTVLTSNGTTASWSTPAGTGDVTAAVVITDHTLVRGDGGAKGIQDSGITIDDSDNVTGITELSTSGDVVIGGSTALSASERLQIDGGEITINSGLTEQIINFVKNTGVGVDRYGGRISYNRTTGDMTLATNSTGKQLKITNAGQTQVPSAGSDTVPDLLGIGDTDTGLKFGGSNDVRFIAGASEKMRLDGNGRLSLGATSAGSHKLFIEDTGSSNIAALGINLTVDNTFSWASSSLMETLTNDHRVVHFFGKAESTRNAGYIGYRHTSDGSVDNHLTFGMFGADDLMALDGSGKLGIGNNNPDSSVHVGSVQNQFGAAFGNRGPTGGNSYEFGHGNTAGYGSVLGNETGSGAPFIAFNAQHGTNSSSYRTRGRVGMVIRGNSGTMNFGRVSNSNADNQSLQVNATIQSNNNWDWYNSVGTNRIRFDINSDTALKTGSTSWGVLSDSRIKQNITPITNALGKLEALNPTHFEYINSGINGHRAGTTTGFIAQEFETVFPGHVKEIDTSLVEADMDLILEGEKFKIIEADLIPYLVKALQELKVEKDILQAEQDALQATTITLQTDLTTAQAATSALEVRILALETPVE